MIQPAQSLLTSDLKLRLEEMLRQPCGFPLWISTLRLNDWWTCIFLWDQFWIMTCQQDVIAASNGRNVIWTLVISAEFSFDIPVDTHAESLLHECRDSNHFRLYHAIYIYKSSLSWRHACVRDACEMHAMCMRSRYHSYLKFLLCLKKG